MGFNDSILRVVLHTSMHVYTPRMFVGMLLYASTLTT